MVARSRRAAGLTQAQLASRLGISQAAVAQMERPGSNPRVATLDRGLRSLGLRLVLNAEVIPPGIDESLIRQQLELTPAERLAALEVMYEEARKLAAAGVRARGGLA